MLEQLYDARNIGDAEDNMPAYDHAHGYEGRGDNDVIDADALLLLCQKISDYYAEKKTDSRTDGICAYSMSENVYCWIHVTNQKQLLHKEATAFFQI